MKVNIWFKDGIDKDKKGFKYVDETCIIPKTNEVSIHFTDTEKEAKRFDLEEIKQISTYKH